MELRKQGSSQGLFCTKCDWAVVTTYFPDIVRDTTNYHIYLINGNPHDATHIKMVADITKLNYIKSKALLMSESPEIFVGRAVDIIELRDRLNQAGLFTDISPDFTW